MSKGGVGNNGGNLGFEIRGLRGEDDDGLIWEIEEIGFRSGGFLFAKEKGRWEVGNWGGVIVWAGLG